jgi:putative ABC transport system permease protein
MLTRIRYAIRSLSHAPLLSLVVVLSLGLGVGANTAVFSLLHQIILSSLPVARPGELVLLTAPADTKGGRNSTGSSGDMEYIFSYPLFRELEKRPAGLTGLAAFRDIGANLAYGAQTVSGDVLVVSGGYFPTLGVRPLLGRTIDVQDDRNGGNPVAVLGYGYWHDRLGDAQDALNRTIRINGVPFTIVGVAPKAFTGTTLGEEPAAYLPLALKPKLTPDWDGTKRWDDFWLYMFGRVQPGVSMQKAQAGLNSVFSGLAELQVKTVGRYGAKQADRIRRARLTLHEGSHGSSAIRDQARAPVMILMAATVLVLLIAIANAANLLLARSAQRRRELAIRAAMGAGRGEIMSQLFMEALILATAGGAAALGLAFLTLRLLVHQITAGSETPQYFLTSGLELPVLLFSLGVSLLTGLLFGFYPAWEAARVSVASTLKDESGQSSGTRGVARVRKILVCTQVAVATILLIPTGLFLKSMVNLFHVDLGIRTDHVIEFALSPELNGYKPENSRALFERVESEVAAIPGVRGVSSAMVPLIGDNRWGNDVVVEGFTPPSGSGGHSWMNAIGRGYFGKMGIPLIAGREFSEADNLAGPQVAVINEEFVRRYFQGRNPIGSHFGNSKPEIEIVGVVKDSHYASVKEKPYPVYYTPWRQDKRIGALSFYVHSPLPAEQIIPQIRRLLTSVDRNLPAEHLRTLDEQIALSISDDRIVLQLSAAFAILATMLATLGLYGVMAHNVTRRTQEIGIRMALGASPTQIRGMVMREMTWIVGIGLALGIPAALALARYVESQLYGVKPWDAVVVVSAALAMAITAAAAAYVPARRAAKITPMRALRYE